MVLERPESSQASGVREVYASERAAVLRHLLYPTGNTHLAEDLAQEAFRRLVERRSEDGDLQNPHAWLLKVASNLAYSHSRGESRRTDREQRSLEVSSASDLDDVIDVRRALESIDPRDRSVPCCATRGSRTRRSPRSWE
jgi:DNA-directed RNA polymerase specialized sigma24 family protein